MAMVMASGTVCQQLAGEAVSEAGEASDDAGAEAAALHERLVAYVHALAGGHEARSGVWVEHSYARARGAAHAPAAHVRVLLAPRIEPEPGDVVDVERVERPPPEPPALPCDAPDDDDDDESDEADDDDWEARVASLAPAAPHARLASVALEVLRRLRLARLAAAGATERAAATRAAARRLRLALASAAAHPGAHAQWPAAWLHGTLLAYMPRSVRRQYDAVTTELRRMAPRLAERMTGTVAPTSRYSPARAVGPRVESDAGPWLVWLGCGRSRLDARWSRRLGALLHTRVLSAPRAPAAPPEAWCAAVAGGMRAALADTLAEAGRRAVILGGVGAGAALCIALAAGAAGAAGVRGLVLLAPPLLTAEGARDSPDDALSSLRAPALVVAGTGAAQCWRGAAREVARGAARRVLEVRGADDALRLGGARRRRLPQHALDAAVAEECARWALEVADAEGGASPERERERERERDKERERERPRRAAPKGECESDEEEYAHLPTPPHAAPSSSISGDRPIEIVGEFPRRVGATAASEARNSGALGSGRLVSRGSGATPLALLPPRRRPASPPAPAAPLAAADIMRLPIVFADDEPGGPAAGGPVTVTAGRRGGAARYTRVIVASRGGARPVLLRRGLRLLPRADRTQRPH